MATDWKDALNALKNSGNIPVDDTPDPQPASPAGPSIQKEPLHVVIDKKGRKGKAATIIEGFLGSDPELEDLARSLKQRLATGGSCRDGEILIQGERRQEVADFLKSLGYKVK